MNEQPKPGDSKILIVDDVPKNIQLLGMVLRREGYGVEYSISGIDALGKINKSQFDLILLDVMMPELNGFETCRRIKQMENYTEVPVIFLTAKTETEAIVEGFESGGVDYLTKPFNNSELLVRVKNHLNMRHYQKSLSRMIATKDKFFSIIAHDLRNPIGAFKNITELLADSFDDLTEEEKKDFIGEMKNSTESIYSLLENLLTWSRSQQGLINLFPENFKAKKLIEAVVKSVKLNAGQKNIEISLNIENKAEFHADYNTVETVLRNIATNAIKYTHTGGKIEIGAVKKDEYILFHVRDNGIGMDTYTLNKLFSVETNTSMPGTNSERGTGLGLILCSGFVKMNKGQIWAESSEGIGSVFYFTLPAAKPEG